MFINIKSKQAFINVITGLVKKNSQTQKFKFTFWEFSNKLNKMREINTFLG
jgi:hypothetical protein